MNQIFVRISSNTFDTRLKELKQKADELIFNHVDADCWIAGGWIRTVLGNEDINNTDIDVYSKDDESFDEIKFFLKSTGFNKITDTANSMKLFNGTRVYDLIKMPYDSPIRTIDSFDFTVCCSAISRTEFYHHPEFYMDLAAKRLVLHKNNNSLTTLYRLLKYINKGYTIPPDQLLALAIGIKHTAVNKFTIEQFTPKY